MLLAQRTVLIPEPTEVADYLNRYQELIKPLILICERAGACFTGGAQLSLELYRDRESEDACLTLYVRQAVYTPDILERIESVRAHVDDEPEWSDGCLLLTTDFQPPRQQDDV